MTIDLEKTTEFIIKYTKECEEMMSIISKYMKDIETQKNEIETINIIIKKDELKCQEMYDLALSELKLNIRELEEATDVTIFNNILEHLTR